MNAWEVAGLALQLAGITAAGVGLGLEVLRRVGAASVPNYTPQADPWIQPTSAAAPKVDSAETRYVRQQAGASLGGRRPGGPRASPEVAAATAYIDAKEKELLERLSSHWQRHEYAFRSLYDEIRRLVDERTVQHRETRRRVIVEGGGLVCAMVGTIVAALA